MAESDKKAVAGGVFWLSLERIIGFSVSFFGGIVLARILQPDDFGTVAFATATFLMFSRLCGIGVNQEIVRADESRADYRIILSTYFWLNTAVVLLFFLLITGVIFLSGIFHDNGRLVALIIAGGWTVSNLCDPGRSLLQKEMRFRVLSFLQWLPGLCGMGGAVLLAVYNYGVWALCVPQMLFLALAGIASLLISGYRPGLVFDRLHARALLKNAKWYVGNGFCEGAYQRIDDLAIGQFLGQAQLGFYDRAYMLGGMFHHNAGNVISRIIFPLFAKRASDQAGVSRLYSITIRFVLYSAFFVLLLFSIYCPQIIIALWGEKWLEAAVVFRYMAPYSILLPAFYISKDVMISLGNVRQMSRVYLWVLLTIIILIYPGIRFYGLNGAAIVVDLAIVVGLGKVALALRKSLVDLRLVRTFFVPGLVMLSLAAVTVAVSVLLQLSSMPLWLNVLLTVGVCTTGSVVVLLTLESEVLALLKDLVCSLFQRKKITDG